MAFLRQAAVCGGDHQALRIELECLAKTWWVGLLFGADINATALRRGQCNGIVGQNFTVDGGRVKII